MRVPLTLLVLVLSHIAAAAETMSERSFQGTSTKPVGTHYLLFTPAGYDDSAGEKWPLLLFLHGSGERGDDLWQVAMHGPPKLLRGRSALSDDEKEAAAVLGKNFIVISPQCPSGQLWEDDTLIALLDAAESELKVDRSRVYLTGLSMGGYGAWSLASHYPERFAAVVPICGGGSTIELVLATNKKKTALRSLAIHAFHGARDPTVPLSESERMVSVMKQGGVKEVDLTVYPEATHDSWTATYANAELYTWLLRHERKQQVSGK